MDYQTLTAPLPKPFLAQPLSWPVINANVINAGPLPGPVVVSQYSQTSSTFVVNTNLGSLTAGATSVGSLTIPPLPVGSVVKITAFGEAAANNDSVNYALYIDAKQATSPTAIGIFTGTNGVVINSYITIKSPTTASIILNAQMNPSNTASNFQIAAPYNSTISHQIDIFANIATPSANNSFTCGSFFVELSSVS
jgi:hypothetical protein